MKKLTFILILLSLSTYAGQVDVCIDPGHGWSAANGGDPGVVNHNYGEQGPYESDFNKAIGAEMSVDLYWGLGYIISMTRIGDECPSLEARCDMANGLLENPYTGTKDTCQIFVSVHNNGLADNTVHGTETYYYYDGELADDVQSFMFYYISNYPYAHDLDTTKGGKYVLIHTKMPAALTESAFVTHDVSPNAQWFQLSENHNGFLQKIAWGIDNGIDYFYAFDRLLWLRRLLWGLDRGSISLEWSECPVAVTGYNIYRRSYPNTDFELIVPNHPNTYYTDYNVVNGGVYAYHVNGVKSGGQVGHRSEIVVQQVPPFSSNIENATGMNSGNRLLFDNDGMAHLSWAGKLENEELGEDVWYCASTDYGSSWSIAPQYDYGWQPTIDVNSLGKLNFCCISTLGLPDPGHPTVTYTIQYNHAENGFWYNKALYETEDSILSISFAIDNYDTAWVLFNEYDINTYDNYLKLGKFYTEDAIDDMELEGITTLDTYAGFGKGAIAIGYDNHLRVVYERQGYIYYKSRRYGQWYGPNTWGLGISHNPSICVNGDCIHFIWEEWNVSNTRIKTLYCTDRMWYMTLDISGPIAGQGCYPYIEKGSVATWSRLYIPNRGIGLQGYWEVYKSERNIFGNWSTPQNISQSFVNSKYPQVAMHQTVSNTNLAFIWTENSQAPFDIKIHTESSGDDSRLERPGAIPFYALNLGEEQPSVFTEHREGYIVYEEHPAKCVDCDSTYVSYEITGLNPQKKYSYALVFYQDEDNSTWKEYVEIDDSIITCVQLPRKRVIIFRDMLSAKMYNDQIIKIKVRKGGESKAVLATLALWEYSNERNDYIQVKDLPQKSTKNNISTFAVIPNPSASTFKIQYNVPSPCKTSIKIYDVSGRLVKNLFNGRSNVGMNEFYVKRGEISSGVYFVKVETDGYSETQKVILVQ
jgi:N-acetylmuramoyl-L-alanine amidase